MIKLRVYIDTSVIGGCFDEEFQEDSFAFFTECEKGLYLPVVSDLILYEIQKAPLFVQEFFQNHVEPISEQINFSEQAQELS